jgi:hypothetical protein
MLPGQSKKASNKIDARVHSIAALLKENRFDGSFDAAGASYRFTYTPTKAVLAGQKLLLEGRLIITDAQGRGRTRERVRALLASTQGGIGTAPIRAQVLVGGVQSSTAATSGQQQQVAGEGARSGQKPVEPVSTPAKGVMPEVDSTGPLSFCGAMYFQLEPLDGRAFGVQADLSRVQMNVRISPGDEKSRALQGVYSAIADAIYGKEADKRLAAIAVGELNRLLAVG